MYDSKSMVAFPDLFRESDYVFFSPADPRHLKADQIGLCNEDLPPSRPFVPYTTIKNTKIN
jgi:hypothetical protein